LDKKQAVKIVLVVTAAVGSAMFLIVLIFGSAYVGSKVVGGYPGWAIAIGCPIALVVAYFSGVLIAVDWESAQERAKSD